MPDAAAVQRVRTGVQLLDEKLEGGFPRPSTLLFFSEVPAEKRVFAEHFAVTGLRAGETVLYVDFYRAPQLARRDFGKFGRYPEDRLVFVDATSTQLLVPSSERYAIRDIGDLDHIMDTIERAVEQRRPARVIVDSMEFLTDRFEKVRVLEAWRRLVAAARTHGCVVAFLFINWTYKEVDVLQIAEMSDYVLEFQSTQKAGVLRNSMRIRATRDGGLQTAWMPYTFKDFVGLTLYFPRILVTGPFNAGKSSVVRALSKTSVSIDRMGTTIAFDYGNVDLFGLEAEIFGTPGQERFEFVFKIFAREVSGVLLVVDATRPDDFGRARQMVDLVGPGVPYVVLANKSDLPGALAPKAVREAMALPPDVPVIATSATSGSGVQEALLALATSIVGGA